MTISKPSLSQLSAKSNRNCPDNGMLISLFVDNFVRGQPILVSNAHLRTEPILGGLQLLCRQEGIVSTAKLEAKPPEAWVRQTSRYCPVINQAMLAKEFFPLADPQKQRCYLYQHHDILPGYAVRCTTAKELWRTCWAQGFRSRAGIPMDLLILSRGPAGAKQTWYPIRNMECREGALYIKMLGGEVRVELEDLVAWLQKVDEAPVTGKTPKHQLRPDLRGYYRLGN